MISESCLAGRGRGGGGLQRGPGHGPAGSSVGRTKLPTQVADGWRRGTRALTCSLFLDREGSRSGGSVLAATFRPAAAAEGRLELSLPLFWLLFSHSIRLFALLSCGCGFYQGLVGD